MTIKTYRPKNALLQKYIECFYILEQTPEEAPVAYFTFPTIYTIITCSEHTRTLNTGSTIITEYSESNHLETNLVCNFNTPVLVQYKGKINEITTYFKPLGINAFLMNDLEYYSEGTFPDFNPYDDYKTAMSVILSLPNHDERMAQMENYWISKWKPFEDNLLERVLMEMMDGNNLSQSMTDLANKTGKSRATINKHFDKHICKTPSQFKKIVRFRSAIQSHLENGEALAYNLDYFDQSHMIRDFKKLTGVTPKAFFSKLSTLENGQIKWMFVS